MDKHSSVSFAFSPKPQILRFPNAVCLPLIVTAPAANSRRCPGAWEAGSSARRTHARPGS